MSFTSIISYVFLVWKTFFSLFMPLPAEIVHMCIYIVNTNSYNVLSGRKLFYIQQPSFFFDALILKLSMFDIHIYFANPCEVLTEILNYFTFGSHISSFTHMTLMHSFLAKIFVFLIYAKTFIHDANTYEVSCECCKYTSFRSHIYSFISMTT